ncbi:putative 2-C-methyl-D-erythritol 4-phosphate cytidylyltransferase [Bacteroidales bacterium KA00251]|nr:putative 2-C-methyl-D-erythritol 4-phosphate cytidylyltransferase [Bacteroidales bacterium KA00251]
MDRKCYFVIPAGGCGNRFGSTTPKQYIPILGKPLILYTLEAIMPFADHCILSLSDSYHSFIGELIRSYPWANKCHLVPSGESRFESVKNALRVVPDYAIAAIHDAVRPLISAKTLVQLIRVATQYQAAIPCKPLSDSIREVVQSTDKEVLSHPADRSRVVSIQTPQIFHSERIREAYQLPYRSSFTDDSSVYEACFHTSPKLVEDPYPNIKITHPEDQIFLEAFLQKRNE